jgi:hypothetical protein
MAATDEAAPAEAVPPVSSAEGGAAVASFLSEAGLDSALGPPLCAALAQHGDDPGTWVPTLIAMPADTFDELIQSVKDHDPAGEDGSSPASAGELPSTREMVVQIFNAIDEDKDKRLKFAECVQLAVRTGGTMDKGTYDEVAAMVGAAGEEGLTLSNLEDVREAALAPAPLMAGAMLRAIVCTLELSATGGTLTPFVLLRAGVRQVQDGGRGGGLEQNHRQRSASARTGRSRAGGRSCTVRPCRCARGRRWAGSNARLAAHRAAAITGRAIFVGERRARRATRPRVGRCSAAK